ncbi:MAG: LacI family DNA-binding transcriptional regulator [Nocardioidaceae bacterium]|nr:LacI family DNA-binding transcriptional regulator [Nocardioidaceae bacterium]NUS50333.1 LacI family DNA-binding transcriptional regulator [Nocardioidaceae bacterium]
MGIEPPSGGPPAGTTLFAWVKASLRDAIARGDFAPDEPFVTQRQIVEQFGVSTTTAVRALNDLVAEGLVVRHRGKGTFVAETEPAAATPARRSRQRTVAFVSPNDVDPHQVAVRAGIAAECQVHDHRLVVATTPDLDSENAVLRRTVEEGADGVIAYLRDHSRAATTVDELRRAGAAFVLVDRYLPSMPTDAVIFDDFAIGYEVTSAVLDRGHSSPALLWGEEDVTSVRDRLSGHYRALRDRGLSELPERSALRDYSALSPDRRQRRLRSLIDSPGGLTAIIGGNAGTMAMAASDLLALPDGFPGTIELANMDELGPYDVSPMAVVSATLPARDMGATAARVLHARMSGSTEPLRHVVLPGRVHSVELGRNRLSVTGSR